jgi:Fic family protein
MTGFSRAGEYRTVPGGGGRAFYTRDLPPQPPLDLGALTIDLSAADRALARLDGRVTNLPQPEAFVAFFTRAEAIVSSRIEGTMTTVVGLLQDEAAMATTHGGEPNADSHEVGNYLRALEYGRHALPAMPLARRLLCEMHAILLTGVRGADRRPGEVRTVQNWIGGRDQARARYVPPPPSELADRLAALDRFINQPDELPPLIRMGLAHVQFEMIHPFVDGNGRLGRLLIALMALQESLLERPVLYLSAWFDRHRDEYYDRLQAVSDDGDWEGWLRYFLRGVEQVARDSLALANAILELRSDHHALVAERSPRSAVSLQQIIDAAYAYPVVDAARLVAELDLKTASVFNHLGRLVSLGLFTEITGRKRDRLFMYAPYVRLLEVAAGERAPDGQDVAP